MQNPTSITNRPENSTLHEAIVVGSGFGGAVTACRLSQAGFNVLVLERGRRYGSADFPSLPQAPSLLPDTRRWNWGTDQGLWDVLDLGDVVSVQAAGYGGGSLIYANVNLRPPAEVFDAKWPDAYAHGLILKDYYDLVAAMLDVAPITASPELSEKTLKRAGMQGAARGLGRSDNFFHPPLAVTYEALPNDTNRFGAEQKACIGCGACCTGCPVGAKNTLDLNYLALAEQNGIEARTQCEVTGIEWLHDGTWQVEATDHLEARKIVFRARYLFLCAGSVHSTELLARAKKCGVKRTNVGTGYFPGADALGVVYGTSKPQEPSSGPTITTTTVHFETASPSSFFMIQDGGYASELDRLLGFMRASILLGRNRVTQGRQPQAQTADDAEAPRAEPASPHMQSALDDILDALKTGAFSDTISREQRDMVRAFLGQLKEVLLLPELVHGSITRNVSDRYASSWAAQLRDPSKWPVPWLREREAGFMRSFVGGDNRLAGNVLSSIEALADQSLSELLRKLVGYSAEGASHRVMLLAMGRDSTGGVLEYDERQERMVADLDLHRLAAGYANQERLMADIANELGGELRVNPIWSFLGRPITVHNQGGCPMNDDPEKGVTNQYGQVHGSPGLYVLDGSILSQSVGVNPSATIAAIAERNIFEFIKSVKGADWAEKDTDGARQYRSHLERAKAWDRKAKKNEWKLTPPPRPPVPSPPFLSESVGIRFDESMEGYYAPTDQDPRDLKLGDAAQDAVYRRLEAAGTPGQPLRVDLRVSHANLMEFIEDPSHTLRIEGHATVCLPGEVEPGRPHLVRGTVNLLVPQQDVPNDEREARREVHRKCFAKGGQFQRKAQREDDGKSRFMEYSLAFVDSDDISLYGYKRISDKPALGAFRDTSCLFVTLSQRDQVFGAGAIRIEVFEFLSKQIPSIMATGTEDPARMAWATQTFVRFFFGSLQRIYVPELSSMFDPVPRGPRPTAMGAQP